MSEVKNAGQPVMGENIPVENFSGSVKTIGSTRRYDRDPGGRFAVRRSRQVGPLGPAGGTGPGGIESVSGRWIPGVRNNAQTHDFERVHEITATPYCGLSVPDYSSCPAYSAAMDDGKYPHDLRREA